MFVKTHVRSGACDQSKKLQCDDLYYGPYGSVKQCKNDFCVGRTKSFYDGCVRRAGC
jgi:hypothetical protein